MESGSSHGQSTAAASSDHSDWEQQQSGAGPGNSKQEEFEAESAEDRQHARRTQGQGKSGAGGDRTAQPPATAAQEQPIQALHAPYSNLVWCDSVVESQCRLKVASSLYTDIAGVNSSSSGLGTAAVQVTVEVHAASWDVWQSILSQLRQQAPAGQQGRQSVQAGNITPVPRVFGPYAATLSKHKSQSLRITQLQQQHEPQTYLQHLDGKPHRMVLQERVPGSNPPHFKMHLKPGTPDKPGNKDAQVISRAGEGPGLQVAPGSVSEVNNAGVLGRASKKLCVLVPKVLLCSQLPAETTYPLDISLRVLPPPAGQDQGQWTARISQEGRSWCGRLNAAHPLSAYGGRNISKMSLSQDKQLTLTFAPTPTAAAAAAELDAAPAAQHVAVAAAFAATAAAAAPNAGLQAARAQSRLPLKRPAGSPGRQQQQQPVPGGRLPSSQAAAAAAGGGTSAQAAAAPVPHKKPRRGTQQQQQQQATALTAATAAALLRSAPVTVTQEGAGGVQSHTAAGNNPPPPPAAAACFQTSDDDITTAVGIPAAPVSTIKQEAATQEVLDLTADSDGDDPPPAAAAAAAAAQMTAACCRQSAVDLVMGRSSAPGLLWPRVGC